MKVSVIIPVYNVEKTLPRCIDSVIGQSLKDIEIILVDDGSPDKSPEICDEYRCKDSRIKVFHKPNEGLGYTRNYGIERAQGEYVAFVDSDDYIASDMLDKLYNTAIKEDADVVYGGYYRVINGEIRQGSHPIQNRIKWRGKEEIKDLLLDCVSSKPGESEDSKYGATCCKGIYKRAILKDNDIRFYARRDEIKVHVCYNEQGCAYAADGFARTSGKLGVYFTTSGPGAVNGFCGLADAWFDGIPLMCISGNVPTNEQRGFSGVRQNGFQEMDVVSMTKHITKYSVAPNRAESFPDIITRAYNLATTGRKGGVVIDFPYDIQKTSVSGR